MVLVGLTVALPLGRVHEAHTPLSIDREVAVPFVICQDNITCCPAVVIVLGVALKPRVKGTSTVRLMGVALPPGPDALMVKVVVALIGTIDDPEVGSGPLSSVCGTGGVIVIDVALVVAHVIVVV